MAGGAPIYEGIPSATAVRKVSEKISMLFHKPFNIAMLVTGTQCRQHEEEAARRTWLEAVVERYSRQVRIRPEPATEKRHIF